MIKYPLQFNTIGIKLKFKLIKHILTSNKFTMGLNCKRFEDEFAKWLRVKYCLYVNSGSSANLLLIHALKKLYNLKDGDYVLCSSLTWSTNIAPIIQMGLKPIFYDIDCNSLHASKIHLLIINAKYDIKAIMLTHYIGIPLKTLLFKHIFGNDIPIIEDCCLAQGARNLDGSMVGSTLLAGSFSFYFGHHMTSILGGMISTNNYLLYKILLSTRNHGLYRPYIALNIKYLISDKYQHLDEKFLFIYDGFNLRNTLLNAIVGLLQLKKINKIISTRNSNYDIYTNYILNKYIPDRFKNDSSFCIPFICLNEEIKNKLLQTLIRNGVLTRPLIAGNIVQHPFLKDIILQDILLFIGSNKLQKCGFYIGNSHLLNKKTIMKTISLIRRALS